MQYAQFKQTLRTELPINRKERFYTGTVLPSILFHKGTSNFFHFLREIKGIPTDIDEANTQDNFLFYTEYNLKESAGTKSVGAEIYTDTGDTPDVIIEILEPKTFVVIEAKMFSNVNQNELDKQMKAQKHAVVDKLKVRYGLDDTRIFHIALTPKQLKFKATSEYQVINWDFLLDNEYVDLQDNYFANFLRFALEYYDELVSNKSGLASTVECEMPGYTVYLDGINQQTLWVGRKGGKSSIKEDVNKRIWRDRLYVVSSRKPQGGQKGNWITSRDFAAIVDGNSHSGRSVGTIHSMSERELDAIVDRFDTDRRFIVSSAFRDGGLDPLSARLRRAALNQISDGEATVSRYGIWANTVRDNIRQADVEIGNGNITEARRLLCRAANSLSAFAELQARFDLTETGRSAQQQLEGGHETTR